MLYKLLYCFLGSETTVPYLKLLKINITFVNNRDKPVLAKWTELGQQKEIRILSSQSTTYKTLIADKEVLTTPLLFKFYNEFTGKLLLPAGKMDTSFNVKEISNNRYEIEDKVVLENNGKWIMKEIFLVAIYRLFFIQ